MAANDSRPSPSSVLKIGSYGGAVSRQGSGEHAISLNVRAIAFHQFRNEYRPLPKARLAGQEKAFPIWGAIGKTEKCLR